METAVFSWCLHMPCACVPITASGKDAAHSGLELTLMTSSYLFTYDFILAFVLVLLNFLFCIGI